MVLNPAFLLDLFCLSVPKSWLPESGSAPPATAPTAFTVINKFSKLISWKEKNRNASDNIREINKGEKYKVPEEKMKKKLKNE